MSGRFGKTLGNPSLSGFYPVPVLYFRRQSAFTASPYSNPPSFAHAPVPVFSAHPEGESQGGGDRFTPADAARRHDAAGSGRHLCLAAARLSCAEEDRAD